MAKAEQLLADQGQKLGRVWFPPTSMKQLIEQDRIRLAGTDNAMVIEVDGEAWAIPESFQLHFFD